MHRVQNKLGKLRRWKNRISFSSKKLGLLLFPDTHLLKIPYPCAWSPWWPPRLPHPQPCAPVCPPPSQWRLSPPWSIVSTTYPWPNWWPSWWTSGPTDTNRLKISKCVTDLPTDLLTYWSGLVLEMLVHLEIKFVIFATKKSVLHYCHCILILVGRPFYDSILESYLELNKA